MVGVELSIVSGFPPSLQRDDVFSLLCQQQLQQGISSLFLGTPFVDMDEDLYQSLMTRFLFSPLGSKYRFMFSYSDGEELECGEPVPKITVMISEFRHLPLSGSRSQISAMNRIKDIVSGANFTEGAHVFPFAKVYAAWETDEVTLLYNVQTCSYFFSFLPSLFLSVLKLCRCLFSFG